jgi:HD-GYP domain-containing protein (c-di-GMP phosphodiesterase class II)
LKTFDQKQALKKFDQKVLKAFDQKVLKTFDQKQVLKTSDQKGGVMRTSDQ